MVFPEGEKGLDATVSVFMQVHSQDSFEVRLKERGRKCVCQ